MPTRSTPFALPNSAVAIVLIVDDEPANVRLMEGLGYRAVTAQADAVWLMSCGRANWRPKAE